MYTRQTSDNPELRSTVAARPVTSTPGRVPLLALRKTLTAGMAMVLAINALDLVFLPGDQAWSMVTLRTILIFGTLGVALAATFVSAFAGRIDTVLIAMLSLAAAGAGIIAVQAGGSHYPVPAMEPVIITLGIYLFTGLTPQSSALAASPAVLVFMALGASSGIAAGPHGYTAFFLAVANAVGFIAHRLQASDRDRLEAATRELTGLLNTDRLTGIYNRFMFDDHMARVWRQSRRERHNLSLLIVDIDYMDEFNARYGYPEGDRCIRRVAEALKKSVRRPLDFVAHYTAAQFALVLYDPPTSYIRRLVVGIQTSIAELHIPNERSPIGPRVTVSIGAVVLGPETAKSLEGALQFAEDALAASQLRGRDRAVVFQSSDLEHAASSQDKLSPINA